MNKETFENNLRIINESRTKQGKEINHLNDKNFVKWLNKNGLINWLK